MRATLAAICLLFLAATAAAHEFKQGDIAIDHPWARASIGLAKNGAAYMTLSNAGATVDRLVAVRSEVAGRAGLHTHLMDGGVMRMRQVEAVAVAPGEPAVLEPGGLHVMLFGLKAPLAVGDSFPLVLVFENAGEVRIDVAVEAFGPAAGARGVHGGHGAHRHGKPASNSQ